ncbi:MAG: hypothetical protein KGR26_17000 [Cyanobacteria bacterium REEB65]|nr:hypothetical protein [Cyanobacteria bacterium REEB65]
MFDALTRLQRSCLALALGASLTGCAALSNLSSHGDVLQVDVQSPEASVSSQLVDLATDRSVDETGPHYLVMLDRSADYRLTVQSPGYQSRTVDIRKSQVNPWFWADLFGFLPVAAFGALLAIDAPGSEGFGFWLIYPMAFFTPLAVLGTGVDLLTGNLLQHPSNVEVSLTKAN